VPMKKNNFEKLKEVNPLGYSNLDKVFNEWLEIKEDLPEEFWEKLKDINKENNLNLILLRIKQELFSFYGDKRDKAKSFKDSRFTSLKDMIDRGMVTCGSMTKIFATVLRKFGIPTKMVHGILESQKKSFIKSVLLKNRHAWLEIYNPETKDWISIDPTRNDFSLYPDAIKIKEYHDWSELKGDYDKGNF